MFLSTSLDMLAPKMSEEPKRKSSAIGGHRSQASIDASENAKQIAKKKAEIAEKSKDAFLFRFKPGSKYMDRVIPEKDLDKTLNKKSYDDFWLDISSITLTPIC